MTTVVPVRRETVRQEVDETGPLLDASEELPESFEVPLELGLREKHLGPLHDHGFVGSAALAEGLLSQLERPLERRVDTRLLLAERVEQGPADLGKRPSAVVDRQPPRGRVQLGLREILPRLDEPALDEPGLRDLHDDDLPLGHPREVDRPEDEADRRGRRDDPDLARQLGEEPRDTAKEPVHSERLRGKLRDDPRPVLGTRRPGGHQLAHERPVSEIRRDPSRRDVRGG